MSDEQQPPIWVATRPLDEDSAFAPVTLDQPPSSVADDDLEAALTAPPPSPRSLLLTRLLVGALVAVLGFAGGTWFAHRNASPTTGGFAFPTGVGASGLPGLPGAGTGRSGAEGATGTTPATSAVSGKVTVVDGSKVYVTTSSGSVVIVTTGSGTTVATSTPSSVSTLKAGDTVTVQGTTASDGSVAATSITRKAP